MGSSHKTLPLSHPNKRGLMVSLEEGVFINNPYCLPPKGTLYKNFPRGVITKDYNLKFGDYVFTRQGPNSSSGDPTIYFAPPMTEEESETPFETETSYGNHYWPPVLRALVFIPDKNVPITARVGDDNFVKAYRHYTREVYIPSVSEGTLFTVDKFLYPQEPSIPQHDAPVPTRVSWDFLGNTGQFEECLHPKIIIPDQQTAFEYTKAVGESTAASGSLQGQIFPATNFTRWSDYVVKDSFEFENGAYIRTRVTVTPPPEPRRIIR